MEQDQNAWTTLPADVKPARSPGAVADGRHAGRSDCCSRLHDRSFTGSTICRAPESGRLYRDLCTLLARNARQRFFTNEATESRHRSQFVVRSVTMANQEQNNAKHQA